MMNCFTKNCQWSLYLFPDVGFNSVSPGNLSYQDCPFFLIKSAAQFMIIQIVLFW